MKPILIALALAVIVVGLYAQHVRIGEFVYEDERLIPAAGGAPLAIGQILRGRGVSRWSWTQVQTPQASHAISLGLHLVAVALVALLMWQLSASALAAGGAAAIAALHPLQTQAIAYAAERDDLIAAIGVLVAANAAAASRWLIWLLVPVGAWLAYAGKETGIAVAAIVPLVLWMRGRLDEWMVWLGGLGAWIALVVLTDGRIVEGVQRIVNIGESDRFATAGAWEWLLLQSTAVYRLLMLSIVPWPGWLTPDPDIAIVPVVLQAGAAILLVALCETAWRLRRSQPFVAFGVAWCLAGVLPRLFVQTPWSYIAEAHWYLSLIGLSLAAGAWIAGVKELRLCR